MADLDCSRDSAHQWLRQSAQIQRLIAQYSGRSDVIARVGPHDVAEGSWLGGYHHGIAEVHVDSRLVDGVGCSSMDSRGLGDDDPLLTSHREVVALVAAAHARHSGRDPDEGLHPAVLQILRTLEAARVTRSLLTEHPDQTDLFRAWRGSRPDLPEPAEALETLIWSRIDVVTSESGRRARRALQEAGLAPARLEGLIDPAIRTADGDAARLTSVAEQLARMCSLMSVSVPVHDGADSGLESRESKERREPRESRGAENVTHTDGADDALARSFARMAASRVFTREVDVSSWLQRDPSPALRAQARAVARTLRRVRYRSPMTSLVASTSPPGRLRLDELVRREAQIAARAHCTARPWRRLKRQPTPQPPLHVGLSWDISRSRAAFHTQMAELAWALAWGMRHSSGHLAAVAWNSRVLPVMRPGHVAPTVTEPPCEGGSTGCAESIRALDGVLDLTGSAGARVLIVMTDLTVGKRRFISHEVARMRRAGVLVLWVTETPDSNTPPGAENVVPTQGDMLVQQLADAVCTSLGRAS